jgi:hypothetical protein
MNRKLKTLGLALVAVFAVSAVAAPVSSASPELHSETGHTILTGNQITANELALDAGTMKCASLKFDGTIEVATTTTFGLTPTFSECKFGAEINALFTHNECRFRFHVGPNTEHLTGSVDIVCPDNQQIEIDAPMCTITIPPQANLQGVTYTNENEGMERSIVLDINLVGIDYEEHGMLCENETETTNNGTYTGRVTVTGENTNQEHRGIWIE